MDDDMEDEIIYEVFTAHVHILWRYVGVTTAGLVDLLTPAPGETFRTKISQPGPLMFIMFLVIVASVAVQSGGDCMRRWVVRAHYLLGHNCVSEAAFRPISGLEFVSGSLGADNVTWEMKDGMVGLYGMQGRRGNMEDRYCILQDVDVGEKKMSFFGVFDGHGGHYTAEFVKDNLFHSTIEKIKQLRSQMPPDKPTNGNNNNSITRKSSSGGTKAPTVTRKGSGAGAAPSSPSAPSSATLPPPTPTSKTSEPSETPKEQTDKEASATTTTPDAEASTQPKNDNKGDASKPRRGSGLETISPSNPNPSDPEVPLKKDDTYASVNLKKRNSVTSTTSSSTTSNNGGANSSKDKKEEISVDAGYMDAFKNINYTRLLTDQIMAVDKLVVEKCKSRTDMSGTTAVIAVLDGELLIIGNVGDSRAVMGDLKGSTIPLSFDHKPNQLKERRRIKEAGGFITFTGVWRVAGILATSRALGDFPLKEPRQLITAEPDILTFSLRDHKAHFVILATDGLWDVLTNEEAVAFVRHHIHEPDFGAKSLTLHAYHKGSQDNITVAVLNIGKLSL